MNIAPPGRPAAARRAVIAVLLPALAGALAIAASQVRAQAPDPARYPVKPVQIVVPVAVGGSTDTLTRLFAKKLGDVLGQQMLVDNRGGAGGMVGTGYVAQAAPDGYTLLSTYAAHTITPFLYPKVPYDAIKSFVPIIRIANQPVAIYANPEAGIRSLPELVAYAKKNPGKLSFGISVAGSSGHLAFEQLKQKTGTDIVPIIYKSAGATNTALIAGEVQVAMISVTSGQELAKAGRILPIAALTPKRVAQMPGVPTAAEGGFPIQAAGWTGLLGPAGLPPAIVRRLADESQRILASPEMQAALATHGAEPAGEKLEEFGALLKQELAEAQEFVKHVNIKGY
ncbi:MAG: tripartite tricarboxylate transporter substrate-binding protein [Rubrivivax sp.]